MKRRNALPKKQGLWGDVLHRFLRNRMAVFGAIVMILLILCALLAPLIAPYGYDDQDASIAKQPPGPGHPFGTDNFGRDILSRIIYGSQISLQVGLIAVAIGLLIGGTLGTVAAFYGGKFDTVIMRFMDVLMAIPGMLLAIAIAASLGTGLRNMMIAIGLANAPGFARVARAAVLTVKDNEYIEAARSIGAGDLRIMLRHILPNAVAPIIVQSTLGVAAAILSCATLSFLGMGIQPPQAEWGAMLSAARQYLRYEPYMAVFPGLFIMITVFSLNIVGDGIRDAIDPRLKD
ncbi:MULTISPECIES: ABC transporter permease [Anaerotruncus]|nr:MULTISPECIES: ABC transporter permease [Anaerotruncus]MCQ4896648.1 ABC transporter permease [Anaerotruncus sp. DFI.9.16]